MHWNEMSLQQLCRSPFCPINELTVKKTRQGYPRGLVDNVLALLLAGTIAICTHTPLARHLFCVIIRIDQVDTLAHYVGDKKSQWRSRANLIVKVKRIRAINRAYKEATPADPAIRPRLAESSQLPLMLTIPRPCTWPTHHPSPMMAGVANSFYDDAFQRR